MPGVSRDNLDTSTGTIIGGGQSTVYAENYLISVLNDTTSGGATLNHASSTVFINAKAIVRAGDIDSKGHPTTGSSTVFSG